MLQLVNHLCILKTVSVPECCLEEFHSLLCTIVNKCHLLLPVVYDYTENLESKEAMYYLNYRPVARGVLGVLKTDSLYMCIVLIQHYAHIQAVNMI